MPVARTHPAARLEAIVPALVGGLAGGALLWLADALLESWAFGLGTFPERLAFPGPHENAQRVLVALLVLSAAVLAHLLRARRLLSEKELASSRARYQALLENVEDGVVSIAADGTVEYASPASARLVGLHPHELVGRHFSLWIHPGDREAAEAAFGRSLSGSAEVMELRLVAPDGTVRRVRASSRLLLLGGVPTGILTVVTDITGRRETEDRLRQLSRAVEASSSVVVITDLSGCITYVNPKFTEVTGYTAEEALGRNPRFLKSGEMSRERYARMWQAIAGGGEWRGEFHNRRKDGSSYWESASISPIVDAAGKVTHYVAVKEDITARKLAEQALRESEEKYRLLFSRQFDAAALIDQPGGRFVEVNEAFLRLFGYSAAEMARMHPANLWASEAPHTVPPEGATFSELWCRRKDGLTFPVELVAGAFSWQGRTVTCYILRDITERVQRQRSLEELSATDGLTGLANWRTFNDRLEGEWRRAIRPGSSVAVIMADLDHFKAFNDTCGHLAGDECLRSVARAMLSVARRTSDLVARWGGEELAVLLPGTDLEGAVAVAEAMRQAIEHLAIPHPSSPVAAVVTASLGVAATTPGDGAAKERLVEAADAALYEAKRDGRNRVSTRPDPVPAYDAAEGAGLEPVVGA